MVLATLQRTNNVLLSIKAQFFGIGWFWGNVSISKLRPLNYDVFNNDQQGKRILDRQQKLPVTSRASVTTVAMVKIWKN